MAANAPIRTIQHQVIHCIHRGCGCTNASAHGWRWDMGRERELAAQLAVHFERGGEVQRAVHYWQQTGENAGRRHAYPEALAALRKGLALLATLPESPARHQDELTLQLSLGELLIAAKGLAVPEVGDVYIQANRLCHQLGEPPQRFRVLQGLCGFHVTQAELALQLTNLAHRQREADLVLAGQVAVGAVALLRGNLVAARAHLEPYLSRSDTPPPTATPFNSGQHYFRVTHLAWMVQLLWKLGYADQAQQRSAEALALAQQSGDPPSLTYAQLFAAILAQFRRDTAATNARANALIACATAQGLVHRVAHMQQGLGAIHGTGLKLYRPYFLALVAEASGQAGQPEAGLTVLAEALTLVAATEERWWEAELYRLQGALLLQLPSPDTCQAEGCFRQALDVPVASRRRR
jgi:predicted ATPase